MRKNRMLRIGGFIAAMLVLAAPGCTAAPAADPEETEAKPYVAPVLVGATTTTSPLEDSEWVIAARAYDVAVTEAINAADFTIEPLLSVMDVRDARQLAQRMISGFVDAKHPWPTLAGPTPMVPLSVEPRFDDETRWEVTNGTMQVAVTFCALRDFHDAGSARFGDPTQTTIYSFTLLRFGFDGPIRVVSGGVSRQDSCDATTAPMPTWDPAPVARGVLTLDDITVPSDSEEK